VSIRKVLVGKRVRWKVRWLEAGRHRQVSFDLKGDAVNFEADQRRRLQMGGARARGAREDHAQGVVPADRKSVV